MRLIYIGLITAVCIPFPALAEGDRWRNYWKDALWSPQAVLSNLAPAASDQWANRPEEYGQGWNAYGHRLWRRAAQYQLQNALHHTGAAAMGAETRYRPCGCTGVWRRTGYALSRTLVTRTTSGNLTPNLPFLGGYIGGAMIATVWYPERFRATSDGVRFAALQLSVRTAGNLAREFSTELKRGFRLRSTPALPPGDVQK